jgi:hypothetical protein
MINKEKRDKNKPAIRVVNTKWGWWCHNKTTGVLSSNKAEAIKTIQQMHPEVEFEIQEISERLIKNEDFRSVQQSS